jgi:hypothetical protein
VRISPISSAALALLAALSGGARADERHTTVSLGIVVGAHTADPVVVDGPAEPRADGFGGPRLTLGWEHAPLPYPAQPGYAVDVGLVPEIVAGAYLSEEKGEAMLGVGLRGELRVSQKQQGLLRVSIRAAFYVTGRALVVGDQRDILGELVFGEYILFGRGGRFGFEVGGVARREAMDESHAGITGQLYLGWRL